MTVVCEWIHRLIAVEMWGWCNKVYGVRTANNVHNVHNVHSSVHTVHTLHTVRTLQLTQFCIQFTNNWHLFISNSFSCPFPC